MVWEGAPVEVYWSADMRASSPAVLKGAGRATPGGGWWVLLVFEIMKIPVQGKERLKPSCRCCFVFEVIESCRCVVVSSGFG